MTLETTARDAALVQEIADYIDLLASDCEAFAQRGIGKRENATRAKALRDVARDIREIRLV